MDKPVKKFSNMVRRQDGRLLYARSNDLFDDGCYVPAFLVAATALDLFLFEWLHEYGVLPFLPGTIGALFVVSFPWLFYKAVTARGRNSFLPRGAECERIVVRSNNVSDKVLARNSM